VILDNFQASKPIAMRKTLFLLLLSATLMHAPWAHGQQNVRIIGKVVGPNDWSLSNAHVVNLLLGEGVTTDNYGTFHINIADTGTVLRVSHVGYHPLLTSITPDMIAAKEGGVVRMTLRMTKQSTLLDMVDVPAQDHSVLMRQRGTVLFDFAFMGENMLLLLAENGVRKLVLKSPDMARMAELPIGRKGEGIYQDCLGHLHLFGPDTVYQIDFHDDVLSMPYAFNTRFFVKEMADCATSTDSHIFFSSHQKAGQEVNHYAYHRETKQPRLLRQVMDYDAIRAMEEYYHLVTRNVFRSRMRHGRSRFGSVRPFGHEVDVHSPFIARPIGLSTRENWYRSTRLTSVYMPGRFYGLTLDEFYAFYPTKGFEMKQKLKQNWEMSARERMWTLLMNRPIYSPMFALRDSVYVFDHELGLCHVHAGDGVPVRTFPIVHHDMREWKSDLVADTDGKRLYARMKRGATAYLAEIDLDDGSIISRTRLQYAPHVEMFKVRNGHAYFVVETSDIREPSKLVRQRL